eukprot:Selendium_serpulae@DN6233_c1_g2_i2.p1
MSRFLRCFKESLQGYLIFLTCSSSAIGFPPNGQNARVPYSVNCCVESTGASIVGLVRSGTRVTVNCESQSCSTHNFCQALPQSTQVQSTETQTQPDEGHESADSSIDKTKNAEPTSLSPEEAAAKQRRLHAKLQHLVERYRVVLFMKGTPAHPKCKFSKQV